jgi:alpha-L-fucosidase
MSDTTPIDPTASTLQPYGPVPSARQLKWHEMETYGFLHFTVNTFTDREWGYGDESSQVFNPTDLDADQIVSTAKDGGLKGLILTCKHHDGFCLWPSAFTEHSVKHSPWRHGQGDVVREISDACARHGIRFGVYLSPWDRNRHDYGHPSYVDYYRHQLQELLGNYGPVFEVWFDGANGGDGYYGGARETRRIDATSYYGWATTWNMVRDMQPDVCMFSDVGPDIRWVGNENGIAGDPCWATLTTTGFAPGQADAKLLNSGCRNGQQWLPAECDVSIRPGWFYHPSEDARVKAPTELVNLYYHSVGRGASLLLNLPPDRRGRIHEQDAASLRQFRDILDQTFAVDLAHKARATSPQTREPHAPHAPSHVNDGDPSTFWCPQVPDSLAEAVLTFDHAVSFNVISLREYIALGQRVDEFAVDAWSDDRWVEIARGTAIGSRRLLRTQRIDTTQVRLRVIAATARAAISEFALFLEPNIEMPV